MSKCEITTSVFSAKGRAAALGVRKGWLAEAADQLITDKRYVGKDATAKVTEGSLGVTKGRLSTIVDDCENDCLVYGQDYTSSADGRLKSRASIDAVPDDPCDASIVAVRVRYFGAEACGLSTQSFTLPRISTPAYDCGYQRSGTWRMGVAFTVAGPCVTFDLNYEGSDQGSPCYLGRWVSPVGSGCAPGLGLSLWQGLGFQYALHGGPGPPTFHVMITEFVT